MAVISIGHLLEVKDVSSGLQEMYRRGAQEVNISMSERNLGSERSGQLWVPYRMIFRADGVDGDLGFISRDILHIPFERQGRSYSPIEGFDELCDALYGAARECISQGIHPQMQLVFHPWERERYNLGSNESFGYDALII